jgi:hypothetical protein
MLLCSIELFSQQYWSPGTLSIYPTNPATTKVGIGTSTPSFLFHIVGKNANSEGMTLGSTTTGNFALTSYGGNAYGLFAGVCNHGNAWLQAGRYDTPTAYNLILQPSGGSVGIGTHNITNLLTVNGSISGTTLTTSGLINTAGIYSSGKVGIGIYANPNYMLTVDGGIVCTEVQVVTNPGQADYVFNPTYRLRTINEVESFVKENNHLPEVPSAAEAKEKGYNLTDMDNMLLKKIEELTLYTIELNKRLAALESENNRLKLK